MQRTLIIGDVHGCLDELLRLLEACGATGGDRILQVGDLIAKGPDSRGVLQLCRERGIEAVLGNHDAHVLRQREHLGTRPPSSEHERVAASLTAEDWQYLEALPLWRELPDLQTLVVHAGVVPGVPLAQQQREHLLTLRSLTPEGRASKRLEDGEPWARHWSGPPTVVFGHDAVRGLQQYPYAIGLDTGCVYGRALTAWVLPERRFVSVPSARVYVDPHKRD